MTRADTFVSVVAPLHNDGSIVADFIREVHACLEGLYTNFEIVLVDDASDDDTVALVSTLLTQLKCLRLMRLSRHMGDETAIVAGLESAIGDYVLTMIPDTDPPAEIEDMVETARSGYDVVVGITDTIRGRGFAYRSLRRLFYALARWLVRAPLTRGATTFRVLSRRAVNAMTSVRHRRRYFGLLAADIGYASTTYTYVRLSRSGRAPGPGLAAAIRLGLSVIVHYSNRPLRFVSAIGMIGSLLSVAYAVYVVLINLLKETVMEGWTTLSLQVSGLFLLLFLMMALIGEYLGRILEETGAHPLYYVESEQISSVMISETTRRNVLDRSTSEPTPVGDRGHG